MALLPILELRGQLEATVFPTYFCVIVLRMFKGVGFNPEAPKDLEQTIKALKLKGKKVLHIGERSSHARKTRD